MSSQDKSYNYLLNRDMPSISKYNRTILGRFPTRVCVQGTRQLKG